MSDYCVIMTSVPNGEVADKLSKKLLTERLVACIQKQKIESTYLWQGEIVNDNEILLLLKTKKEMYQKIESLMEELHPYEVPEILEIGVERGLHRYLQWMDEVVGDISVTCSIFHPELFALKDKPYKDFNKKLIPNISEDTMIGIRTPELRKLAKKLWKEDRQKCLDFMDDLPHTYFEENNLHAFLIEEIKDLQETLKQAEQFLPYIDNWATCDVFSPKVFKRHPDILLEYIKKWLKSDKTYTIRYGIGLLLSNYLDAEFQPEYLEWVCAVKSEEYYVKMMIAWYFSFALVKQYDVTLPIIKEQRLEKWTHNKAIQKARESSRISKERKELLNSLKV